MVFAAAFGLLSLFSYGQLKKFYTLNEEEHFDTIDFSLQATAGNCVLKASEGEGPLVIYGNPDLERINPSFKTDMRGQTCNVRLKLQEFKSSSVGDGLLIAMFKEHAERNNFWKILCDEDKIYRLNLSYGFGHADVDLSGTSVQYFKVKTGSADILVDYNNGQPNKIEMDTFYVKADMGSIIAKHLDLSRAKYIKANIGFGRALLDFSDANNNKCAIDASVGAGNLDVFLPDTSTPMIIYLKDSPFCGVRIADGFEEVENNVFVNMSYRADAPNLLTFNVDVALGNVAFIYGH